nr:7TM GPCR domain containing protein [Haemonchus contortus]
MTNTKDCTYWILIIIENLITCLALVQITRLIRVFGKTSLFHKNLVRISQALLITFYPNAVGRVVITIYESGILAYDGNVISNVLLSCACFVRVWAMNSLILYFPSVIIERIFASKYITDYEKLPRPWICRVVIPSVHIVSIVTAVTNMLGYCNEIIASILIAAFFLIYCTTFITIYRRDSTKLRNLDRNLVQKKVIYTLSTKFQLKENLKVMKILMHQSIVEAVNTVIGCSLFILTKTVLVNNSQWIPAAHVLSDMCFAISFCMIALVYMVALGEVRLRFFPSWSSKIRDMHGTHSINEHRGASDAYFKQLTNAW